MFLFGIEVRNNLFPQDGILEDFFVDERTVEKLSNFIWETVDPSRVEDDMDPFLGLMGDKYTQYISATSHITLQV